VSKIENYLDQLVGKLVQLKNLGTARLCTLWGKTAPHVSKIKAVNPSAAKTVLSQYKWRILILIVLLYGASKAYDYFFPSNPKGGGP